MADILRFVLLVAGFVLLALAFLSIATLVATTVSNRGAALAMSTFVWFVAVILYDAVALAGAVWLTGRSSQDGKTCFRRFPRASMAWVMKRQALRSMTL